MGNHGGKTLQLRLPIYVHWLHGWVSTSHICRGVMDLGGSCGKVGMLLKGVAKIGGRL